MKRQFILSFLALFLFTISLNAQIRVNEIVASNSASYSDENGKFGDWIEIYNASNISVNIGGYYFSDDPAQPTKWQLPTNKSASTTIGAKSFLILWADGEPTDGPLHLDFKLSASGESVVITAADGTDRKSTRLNSSHVRISYAVFCLKKKNRTSTKVV